MFSCAHLHFQLPPSANPTHPLGRNEATCATALFLLNTNTFQQNTKISTNTFQLLSCLPFCFCTRHHYKFYSNYFVTLLAVPANTQDSPKHGCCPLSNMTSLLFSPQKWHQICVTFLLCNVDRRNFSMLKTLGTLLGGKMFRKSSPIHWCLKFKR